MPPMSKAGRTRPLRGEAGYTYASILILLVGAGLAAQITFVPTATDLRRQAEEELLHRGRAYARAIESYWRADPANPAFPPDLDDLLDDPRFDGVRHIRRLYDPVIADAWQTIPAEGGGIAGVRPDSQLTSFRQANFPADLQVEEGAATYSAWQFIFDPEEEKNITSQ